MIRLRARRLFFGEPLPFGSWWDHHFKMLRRSNSVLLNVRQHGWLPRLAARQLEHRQFRSVRQPPFLGRSEDEEDLKLTISCCCRADCSRCVLSTSKSSGEMRDKREVNCHTRFIESHPTHPPDLSLVHASDHPLSY